jgi:hypothetical protein
VVQEHAGLRVFRLPDRLAVDRDHIQRARPVAELGEFSVEGDPPGLDPGLELAARAQTGGSQQLL